MQHPPLERLERVGLAWWVEHNRAASRARCDLLNIHAAKVQLSPLQMSDSIRGQLIDPNSENETHDLAARCL
jgi:hypothetical protein